MLAAQLACILLSLQFCTIVAARPARLCVSVPAVFAALCLATPHQRLRATDWPAGTKPFTHASVPLAGCASQVRQPGLRLEEAGGQLIGSLVELLDGEEAALRWQ